VAIFQAVLLQLASIFALNPFGLEDSYTYLGRPHHIRSRSRLARHTERIYGTNAVKLRAGKRLPQFSSLWYACA